MRGLIIIGVTTTIIILASTSAIWYLDRTAASLAELLLTTQEAIIQENWALAEARLDTCLLRWQKLKPGWSALINHQEVDEIQMALERVKEYVVHQDKASASAELAVAKLMVEHVPEKEKLSWSNIL